MLLVWLPLQAAMSMVDVLCSFAAFTATPDGPTCRPILVDTKNDTEAAVLDMEQLWHPAAVGGAAGRVVPNDLCLGGR